MAQPLCGGEHRALAACHPVAAPRSPARLLHRRALPLLSLACHHPTMLHLIQYSLVVLIARNVHAMKLQHHRAGADRMRGSQGAGWVRQTSASRAAGSRTTTGAAADDPAGAGSTGAAEQGVLGGGAVHATAGGAEQAGVLSAAQRPEVLGVRAAPAAAGGAEQAGRNSAAGHHAGHDARSAPTAASDSSAEQAGDRSDESGAAAAASGLLLPADGGALSAPGTLQVTFTILLPEGWKHFDVHATARK